MSLDSLMIHTCSIVRVIDSNDGYAGSGNTLSAPIASGVPCRVTTRPAVFGEQYKKLSDQYTHKVHFASNPGITDSGFAILWTPPGGTQYTLSVHHIVNPDNMDLFWIAYCMRGD